jgi:hypothetical protein
MEWTTYEQTCEYIRIHSESYIDKILAAHGWSIPNRDATSTIELIHPQTVKDLELIIGPLAESPLAIALEKKWGFNYRQCLGELIYAFITTRPDIGPAVATVAKFVAHPADCRYVAVKRLYRYLRQTRTLGVVYWRSEPRMDLPVCRQCGTPSPRGP